MSRNRNSFTYRPHYKAGVLGVLANTIRQNVEPIGDCRVEAFKAFIKQIFVIALEQDSLLMTRERDKVVEALRIAGKHPAMNGLPLELESCNFPAGNGGSELFYITVRYRDQKRKPFGVPISGIYQGTARGFFRALFL